MDKAIGKMCVHMFMRQIRFTDEFLLFKDVRRNNLCACTQYQYLFDLTLLRYVLFWNVFFQSLPLIS